MYASNIGIGMLVTVSLLAVVNDRADELVQWGKAAGPYARLRALGEGEGDSRFGVANRMVARAESRCSGELHRGHK